MKIKRVVSQHRRDFSAILSCEFCKQEEEDLSCYDDRHWHDKVLPAKKCSKCGKSTISEHGTIDKTETKYPDGLTV